MLMGCVGSFDQYTDSCLLLSSI